MTNYKNNQKASNIIQETQQEEENKKTSFMKNFFPSLVREFNRNIKRLDWTIVIITGLLILIGLISVFSATMYLNANTILLNQTLSVFIGIALVIVALAIPNNWYENIYILMTLLTIIMFALLFLLIQAEIIGGSSSWLNIMGLSLQPSEFVKIVGVLLMAWMMEYSNEELIISDSRVVKKPNVWIGTLLTIVMVLILIQPDLGMTLIITGTLLLIQIIINTPKKWNLITYGVILLGYIMVVIFGQHYGDQLVNQENHILDRLGSFLNPFEYPTDSGYQLIQGMLALSRGGIFGLGIGRGIAKEGALPVIESDYILANIGEETGLVGVFIVLALLFSLTIVIFQRAAVSQSIFRKSVLIGIGSLLFIQTVVNVGGILSVLPLTGVTLPFISAGGSSMIVSISLVGIALRMIAEDLKETSINLVYSKERGMRDGV